MNLTNELRAYRCVYPTRVSALAVENLSPSVPFREYVVWARQHQMHYVVALKESGPFLSVVPELVRSCAKNPRVGSFVAALHTLAYIKFAPVAEENFDRGPWLSGCRAAYEAEGVRFYGNCCWSCITELEHGYPISSHGDFDVCCNHGNLAAYTEGR